MVLASAFTLHPYYPYYVVFTSLLSYIGCSVDRFTRIDGERLKGLRKERALSQQDLEKRSGVAQHTISALEGAKREARPSTIRKLAEALGVEPREIIGS